METRDLSASSVWTIAAGRLQSKSLQCYRQWFAQVTPLRLEEESVLVLGVPDDFYGEWLVENYSDLLGDVLSDIDGMDFSCLFESGHLPSVQAPAPAAKKAAAPVTVATVPDDSQSKRVSLVKHSFDNFIVSDENRLAYMSVRAAVESPGLYNPLYLYGASGVGKTHLLQAAA
ncbi:MAG: DnaA/Hda family protein, partial [Victivallaceae bacterium]